MIFKRMRFDRLIAIFCIGALLAGFNAGDPAFGQVSVLTSRNDISRTSQNLSETILTTSNVNVNSFGKLFTRATDGQVYAQILYMSNIIIPSQGTHNVIFVCTEHNTVYAYDADTPGSSTPLWQVNLGPSVPANDLYSGCGLLQNEIGITSTPVIDPATNTMYVCAMNKDADSSYHHRLHALDITTGADKFGGPADITASGFTGNTQVQRAGLTLANSSVYVTFTSACDKNVYHGWIMRYSAANLGQQNVYNNTPNGSQGGIWQSGMGLIVDGGGNIYYTGGNGTFDTGNNPGADHGNSFVKLNASLAVQDWFTPFNSANLNVNDADLGDSGPLLIPGTGVLVGGGKEGKLYLVNTANLGKYNSASDNVIQSFSAYSGDLDSGPITWATPNNGQVVYVWGGADVFKAFKYTGGLLQTTPIQQNAITVVNSPPLSLSANGSTAGSGIIWAPMSKSDAEFSTVGGAIHALDASNIGTELWNSDQNSARDGLGNYAKFAPATIANGKVYVPTFSNNICVYGLLNAPPPAPTGLSATAGNTQVTLSWSAASGATSYTVKRSTVSGSGYANVSTPTTTSYVNTGLTNGTTYYFVVSATNSFGTSANSAQASATPVAPIQAQIVNAATAPVIDGNNTDAVWSTATSYSINNIGGTVSSSADLSGSFKAAWDTTNLYLLVDVTDDVKVNDSVNPWDDDAVELFLDADHNGGTVYDANDRQYVFGWNDTTAIEAGGRSATGVTFAKVDPTGTTYRIEAKVPWSTLAFTATANAIIGIDIQVDDDDDGGARDGYKTWNDTTGQGWTNPSVFGTGKLVAGGAPAPPTGLTATPGNAQVVLSWSASTGATTYNVLRSTVSGSGYASVATGIASTTYTNTGLTNGTTYYFVVTATNASGTSGNSAQASATPSGGVTLPIQINAAGPLVSPFVADIDFSGGTVATNWTGAITTTGVTNPAPQAVYQSERYGASTYTIPGLTPGTTYTVRLHFCENFFTATAQRTFNVSINSTSVLSNFDIYAATGAIHKATVQQFNVAANASGQEVIAFTNVVNNALVNGIEVVAASAPPAPTGLGTTPGNAQIALSWSASSGATSYNVYRGTAAGGESATAIATGIATTSYTNTGLTNGTHYYYTVKAVNASGTSGASNEANATPVGAAPAFVQVASNDPVSATTIAVPFGSAQTAGNLNIVVVGWNDLTGTVSSVTDSAGNTYTRAIGPTVGSGQQQSIYYAPNIHAGANTVTVTMSFAADYPDIRVLEYSGVTTLDKTAGASGNSAAPNSGSATTTTARELIFTANTCYPNTTGVGAGFTTRVTTIDGDIAADQTVNATGSYAGSATLSASNFWVMQMATFK